MTAKLVSIVVLTALAVPQAMANPAVIARAVATHNALPAKVRTLVFETEDVPGEHPTRVPGWLVDAKLNDREAAAAIAAFGVYGSDFQSNFRSQDWSSTAKFAATPVTVINNSNDPRSLADPDTNQAPSRALTEQRRSDLVIMLKRMGSCTGALVRATRKAAALRSGDDATQLLVKAQRDLGSAVMPPDDSCLR